MISYLKNYPPLAVRALRRRSRAAIVCLAGSIALPYLAGEGSFLHPGLSLFLILCFFLQVVQALHLIFRLRIVPVRLREEGGRGPAAPSPRASAFLESRTMGRAMAPNWTILTEAARRHAVLLPEPVLDIRAGRIRSRDPSELVGPLRRVREDLPGTPPEGAWRLPEAAEEIGAFLEVLDEASRSGAKIAFGALQG